MYRLIVARPGIQDRAFYHLSLESAFRQASEYEQWRIEDKDGDRVASLDYLAETDYLGPLPSVWLDRQPQRGDARCGRR